MRNRFFSLVLTLSLLLFFAGANTFAGGVQTQKKGVKTEKKVEQTKMTTDQNKNVVKDKAVKKTHKRHTNKKNKEIVK